MHMADALISPSVGGAMYAVSAAGVAYSVHKIQKNETLTLQKIPVMGVAAAFVFAAQMINFTIPGTGSSGHLSGGMLLAALLGEFPAVLSLTAVLLIQCLLFTDGGLMALGCNVFNMALCAILIAYPLIFKPIMKKGFTRKRAFIASILACVIGLEIGAFFVTLETKLSGITALPFSSFLGLMLFIHLAIGLMEGVVTATVIIFIHEARPELLSTALESKAPSAGVSLKKPLVLLAVSAVIIAGGASRFASSYPDGLEWSIENITGDTEIEAQYEDAVQIAESIVERTSILPDYAFPGDEDNALGTSVSGIIGGVMTVVLAGGVAWIITIAKNKKKNTD